MSDLSCIAGKAHLHKNLFRASLSIAVSSYVTDDTKEKGATCAELSTYIHSLLTSPASIC
jgi:hypothetical protein